jgi:hypothetical protein
MPLKREPFTERLAQLRRFISSLKVLLMKLSILSIATAALIAASPAFAEDSGLRGTNCGSLTPQQCRAAEILRAQLMLQSARVYAAQPQLTAPSLSRMFAGDGGSNVAQRPRGASRQKLARKFHQ